MSNNSHLAPQIFPITVEGVADGADMTATGVLSTDRVCGCYDEDGADVYDPDLFETGTDVITNNTGVDLSGAPGNTLNFIIARPHSRGWGVDRS